MPREWPTGCSSSNLNRVDLNKKYFKEFNKVLPAHTAVRFFQPENRLDLILDLQLAANLPPVLAKSGATQ
jgi:hypothetical protein